jgi:hypothetical protein
MSNIVLARLGENIKASTAGQIATSSGSTTAPALVDNTFSFRNKIINGGMDVDQRNSGAIRTLTLGTNFYTLDRWYGVAVGAAVTHQRVAITAPRVSFALRITGAAGNTSTWVAQRVESNLAAHIAGVPVTFSFYAASNALTQLAIGRGAAGTPDNYGTTTNDTFVNVPITSTLTRYSISFTAPSTFANGFYIGFYTNAPLLAGQTVTITGVQLEEGSLATAFEQRPIGTELALCQRYYWRPTTGGWGVSTASQANVVNFWLTYPVTMRVAPLLEGANDPPRFTVNSSGLNAQTQPANNYNLSLNALNAEL